MKREGETFARLLAALDVGLKEMRGGKLYLSQESGTRFGAVEFAVNGTMITGPDGTQFDLANMECIGTDGLYAYLRRMSGLEHFDSGGKRGKA